MKRSKTVKVELELTPLTLERLTWLASGIFTFREGDLTQKVCMELIVEHAIESLHSSLVREV